jgi:hypothetical protein
VVITPHFVKPLSPDEKAKLPDFPEPFLPTVKEDMKNKKVKKPRTDSSENKQPEFVGTRGYQEPK